MRLPCGWLAELVRVPDDPEAIAAALARRGFEVAAVEHAPQPVIDFEITANRPDCLSVVGLAREASAAFGVPLRLPDATMPAAANAAAGVQPVDVAIEDPERCPRYCAQLFEVRSPVGPPAWMRERLEAAGVRSISAVVDASNYVMLEMGQPTHAFDYAALAGRALRIRRARAGEKLRTLDGVERELSPEILVIADAERAQAVAGVMGGAASEIGAATTLMVLESAYFSPASIRWTSKRLALKTEASTRFERGADVNAAPAAIARVAALLQQIGAAAPVGPMIDRYPAPMPARELTLRAARIERVLGTRVGDAAVPERLEPLGFSVSSDIVGRSPDSGSRWTVTVPSYRVDVLREVDLIEEIARHDGYEGLPATFPALAAPQPPPDSRTLRDRRLRQVLTACGLSEAMTFAFIEAAAAAPFADPATIVSVANPLSEKFAVLRPSLLAGLIDAAAHNRRREHPDVRLFETGTRFSDAGETRAVAGVWCGAGAPAHWSGGARAVDFYDVKGVVEAIGTAFGLTLEFEPIASRYLVPGRSAAVSFAVRGDAARPEGGVWRRLGLLGQLAPEVLAARGLATGDAAYAFELDVDALSSAAGADGDDLRAASLPRFPSIVRDLSILVDSTLPAAAVRGTIRSSAPPTLVHAIEFDRYRGKGIPEGRVSLSLRLTFRSPERTLTDAEIDQAMDAVVAALAGAHGATRR